MKTEETLVERQVRLVLEQQCADLFRALWPDRSTRPPGCDLTVLALDLGEGGNVAFNPRLTGAGVNST